MTVYFQIAELYDAPDRSIYPFVNTTSTTFNSANVRSSIAVTEGDDSYQWFASPAFSSTNLWLHFCVYFSSSSPPIAAISNRSMIRIFSGGTQRIRVNPTDANGITIETWNGSAWTIHATYSSASMNVGTRNTYDINVTLGASGTIRVYCNNVLIASATNIDTTFGGTVSEFDKVVWGCPSMSSTGVECYYSELIGADWNTIGSKLVSRAPDANGFYAEWTNGNYTVVDDIGGNGDYATSGIAGQRADWSMASFPAPTAAQSIVSVKVSAMINRDIAGPQNANFFIRQGGVDYDDTDQSLNTSQALITTTYTTDPATSNAWTDTTLNSATYGIRSRT